MPGIVSNTIRHENRLRSFVRWDTPLSRLVCDEVLSGKSYPLLPLIGPVRTIVDVGANVGAATVYFALHYPEARILAFEPDPESYRLLRDNINSLAGVEAHAVALLSRDGTATLYPGRLDSVMNSLAPHDLAGREGCTIPVRDALLCLMEQGVDAIDILKLDTEGSEPAILQSLTPLLPKVGLIYLEYHSEDGRRAVDRLLAATHLLWRGSVSGPHRGEFCYCLSERLPPGAGQVEIGHHQRERSL